MMKKVYNKKDLKMMILLILLTIFLIENTKNGNPTTIIFGNKTYHKK